MLLNFTIYQPIVDQAVIDSVVQSTISKWNTITSSTPSLSHINDFKNHVAAGFIKGLEPAFNTIPNILSNLYSPTTDSYI